MSCIRRQRARPLPADRARPATRPARLPQLGHAPRWHPDLDDRSGPAGRWNGAQAYSDSKLFDVVLAFAVARRWPRVLSNALEPGWVPTKMGGPGAPDDLALARVTQAWLAVSDAPAATVTGGYFYQQQPREVHPAAPLGRCPRRVARSAAGRLPAPRCRRRRCCEVGSQTEVAGDLTSDPPRTAGHDHNAEGVPFVFTPCEPPAHPPDFCRGAGWWVRRGLRSWARRERPGARSGP